MNKLCILVCVVSAVTLGLLTGCQTDDKEPEITDAVQETAEESIAETTGTTEAYVLPDLSSGSASSIEGRTVIVSILANDDRYRWDGSDPDSAALDNMISFLGIACDYLTQQAERYGCNAEFIYDFKSDDDLAYHFDSGIPLTDIDDLDLPVWEYIDSSIDTSRILKEYQADNIIYLVLIDSDSANVVPPCTRFWYRGMPYPYEIVYMYNRDHHTLNCPAVYAHEILHTFGAYDLYQADISIGLDRSEVRNVSNAVPNDIMLTCSDIETDAYVYDRITNDITEVTAYYLGLTDSAELLDKIGIQ